MRHKNRYITENIFNDNSLQDISIDINYDDYKVKMEWKIQKNK